MMAYIKLLRIHHWLKNALIFLPLFFSGNLLEGTSFIRTCFGFLSFSLISSCVYIINDLKDIENDRRHPIKKNRPLASGKAKPKIAIGLAGILLLLSIITSTFLYYSQPNGISQIWIVLIPIIYFILNVLYSIWLKHKPIADVVILVSGFLLRVLYGSYVIQIQLSNWLYLMVMFGASYLVFGKRRNEMEKNGQKSRKVLQYYTKDFLDKNMYVFLTLALITYSLWCVDTNVLNQLNTNLMIWSVPMIVIIFLKYSLDIEGNSYGDPVDVVIKDKTLMALILSYIIYTTLVFYVL